MTNWWLIQSEKSLLFRNPACVQVGIPGPNHPWHWTDRIQIFIRDYQDGPGPPEQSVDPKLQSNFVENEQRKNYEIFAGHSSAKNFQEKWLHCFYNRKSSQFNYLILTNTFRQATEIPISDSSVNQNASVLKYDCSSGSKAEYLQKSFPKLLKIESEKLILAGSNFDELTSNAKTLAEDFRDNFGNHKDFAKKDKLGWRNENYGVYGNLF